MSDHKLIVLKFGGSVLTSEDEIPSAIHEIYRWVARGHRVVAVVSALGSTTNTLMEQARNYGQRLNSATIARLAATGESTSASLLGLALDRVGLTNEVHDETSLAIQTAGEDPLDCEIVSLDKPRLQQALSRVDVIVVPGFVGRNSQQSIELLGRGGSDLTALYLARELGAACRLIKDVDGLFEWDPKRSGSPRQFERIAFASALELDETIIQHKAIRFAQQHQVEFEVGSLRSLNATRVGNVSSNQYYEVGRAPEPVKIGLLGLGTVGLGFYQHARKFSSIKVAAIAVRDRLKAASNGAPAALVSNQPQAVIDSDVDVVIELIGGVEPARELVEAALRAGKHVITANKSLIARHGRSLNAIANLNGVKLKYRAAVGGGVPVIESVERIARQQELRSVSGVLNGTCNFVLDKIAQNVSFEDAVLAAQREGFAEADPSLDLEGTDAAEKLVIVARAAGYRLNPEQIECESIDQVSIDAWQQASGTGILRQVSTLSFRNDGVSGKVQIKSLPANHFLAAARGEDNRLVLETGSGNRIHLLGRGAGRYPTSQAVVNDLIELLPRIKSDQRRRMTVR